MRARAPFSWTGRLVSRAAIPLREGAERGVGSDAGERPSALDGLQNTLGPLGGPLLGTIFGENANQRLTRNVNKPNLLGGGSTTVLAGHSMMCNTRYHETPANMLRQAFCALARICI